MTKITRKLTLRTDGPTLIIGKLRLNKNVARYTLHSDFRKTARHLIDPGKVYIYFGGSKPTLPREIAHKKNSLSLSFIKFP